MASKIKNIDPKIISLFYPEVCFHPKKNSMVSRKNQTLPSKCWGWSNLVLALIINYKFTREDNIVQALLGNAPWQDYTLYCWHLKNNPVVRAPATETSFFKQDWLKKLSVPHSTYPFKIYPDFCLGWIWAATPATIHTLLEQVKQSQ